MRNEMRYRQNINQATDLNYLDIFFARIDVLYLFFLYKITLIQFYSKSQFKHLKFFMCSAKIKIQIFHTLRDLPHLYLNMTLMNPILFIFESTCTHTHE